MGDVNYKFTAGISLAPTDPVFRDADALRRNLHPAQTIGDAMSIAERLGFDLVLTHVKRPDTVNLDVLKFPPHASHQTA